MRYIIANVDNDDIQVDGVTTEPCALVRSYEPIDVLDGKMIAWDERGNRYHFISEKQLKPPVNNGLFTTVDVGEWIGEDPSLKLIIPEDRESMRNAILERLSAKNGPKKHWWSKTPQEKAQNTSYGLFSNEELLDRLGSLD